MNNVIELEHPDYYEYLKLYNNHRHEYEEAGAECILEIFKGWFPDLRIKGNNKSLETELKDWTYFENPHITAKSWAREMLASIRDNGFEHELLEVGPPVVTMYPMRSGDRSLFIGVSIMVNHSKEPFVEDPTPENTYNGPDLSNMENLKRFVANLKRRPPTEEDG